MKLPEENKFFQVNEEVKYDQAFIDSINKVMGEIQKIKKDLESFKTDEIDSTQWQRVFYRKEELANNFALSPAEMHIVLEEKKKKNMPQQQLNCLVFEDMDGPDFKNFLENLINDSNSINQRFQIITQSIGRLYKHWSAADILIKHNEIDIIHFDSIRFIPSGRAFMEAGRDAEKLNEILISLHSLKPIKLTSNFTKIKSRYINLQQDEISCSIFALSAALTMSKIPDLHDLIRDKIYSYREAPKNNVERYYISSKNLPAGLIKNAQSSVFIDNYEKFNQETDLNKIEKNDGTKTLKEFVKTRSLEDFSKKKSMNYGIFFTRKNYKDLAQENIEEPSHKEAHKPGFCR